MKILRGLLYFAAILCLLAVAGFFFSLQHYLVPELRETNAQIQRELAQDSAKSRIVMDDAHHVLLEAGLTAKEVRLSAVEQRAYWKQLSVQSVEAVKHADELMVQASQTLKDFDANQDRLTEASVATLVKLQKDLEESRNTLVATTDAIRAANSAISDPKLKEMAAHMEAISANMDKMSVDIQKAVARATKPTSLVVSGAKVLFDFGWKVLIPIFHH